MIHLRSRALTANSRSAVKTHYYVNPSDHLANGWIADHKVGEGRMSRVWAASRGQSQCAVKVFRKGSSEREAWSNEMRIFSRLDNTEHMQNENPLLIRRVDAFVLIEICDNNMPRLHPCIALELVGSCIYDILSEITPQQARKYARDLFTGLSVLHAEDIVHTDISIYNLLLRGDTLIISDFGSSCIAGEETDPFYIGTPPFKSPEMLMQRPIGTATDIWSAFVVTFQMVCGIPMFDLWGDCGVMYGFPEEFESREDNEDNEDNDDESTSASAIEELTTAISAMDCSDTASSSDADEDHSEKHLRMIIKLIGMPTHEIVGGCDHFIPGTNQLKSYPDIEPGSILEFITSNCDEISSNDAIGLAEMLIFGLKFDPDMRPSANTMSKMLD